MREITPESFTVYTLDELEPAAREKAIEKHAARLAGDWWDSSDIEQVSETIVFSLAGILRSPGWETHGEGDFPGIESVELVGWDLDRGDYITVKGELTRANAPAAPWTDDIHAVHLEVSGGDYTDIWCAAEDIEGEHMSTVSTMREWVHEALSEAKEDGRRQLEWLCGAERAEADILANEREFTADGELYVG